MQVTDPSDKAEYDGVEANEQALQTRRSAACRGSFRNAAAGAREVQCQIVRSRTLRRRRLPNDDARAAGDNDAAFGNPVWQRFLLQSLNTAGKCDQAGRDSSEGRAATVSYGADSQRHRPVSPIPGGRCASAAFGAKLLPSSCPLHVSALVSIL